jgi:hypothetical protein
MRQLITNDVFKMSRIIKKLQLDLSDIKLGEDENSDQSFGITILQKIIENAHVAQDDINDFIGSLAGMSGKDFGELPIKESIEIIKEFKNLDGISDFFKSVGQLKNQ